MKELPKTTNPVVIRTDFENQPAWEAICELVRAPVHDGSEMFYAYVEFLEDSDYRNLTKEELLANVPRDYNHSFLFVVDRSAVISPDFAILAVDLLSRVVVVSGRFRLGFRASRTIYPLRTWTSKNSRNLSTRTESSEAFQRPNLPRALPHMAITSWQRPPAAPDSSHLEDGQIVRMALPAAVPVKR